MQIDSWLGELLFQCAVETGCRAKWHNAAGKIVHFYSEEFMSDMLVLMSYI